MFLGEVEVGQDVLGGLLQQLGRGGEPGMEPLGDPPQLGHRRDVVGLGEDGPHDGGHRSLGALGHRGQQVANEMDPAPLPGGAVQDLGDGSLQPSWASEITRTTPFRPRRSKEGRKEVQNAWSSDVPAAIPST